MTNTPTSEDELPLYKAVAEYPELYAVKATLDASNLSTFAKEGILKAILSLITSQRAEAVEEFVKEFQTVAIPETDDYANGWNDCRKRVRKDLNRLAQQQSKRKGDV